MEQCVCGARMGVWHGTVSVVHVWVCCWCSVASGSDAERREALKEAQEECAFGGNKSKQGRLCHIHQQVKVLMLCHMGCCNWHWKQRKLSNRGRHRCSLPGSGGSSTPTSAPVTMICGWCSPSLLPFSSVLAAGLLLPPAPLLLLLLNRPRSPCTAGVRTSSSATTAQGKAARPMESC